MSPDVDAAVAAIREGGIVGLPTDTVYGIGADPLDEAAVGRLFEIKGRPEHKPIGVLVAGIDQARDIGEIEGAALELAREHWPGALTLIVTPKVVLAEWVGDSQTTTLGVRVPDHPVANELLSATGPLAVTSANRSGGPEAMSHSEARALLGSTVDVYVEGVCPGGESSTVLDVRGARPVLLREGPIRI
jgi:tRNA threonylcarbamoyl adenosine modification protein (Sua5/YciO/YrdC/YwlC family)